jgi:hypothetical protein
VYDVTYTSSFGSVKHGHFLLAAVLTAQTAAAWTWNVTHVWGGALEGVMAASQEATATWWAVQAIVAVYFTSGLSKLSNTRWRWIHRSPGLLLHAHSRVSTDSQMGSASWGASGRSTKALTWLAERPSYTRCLFATGLLIELMTPLGLLSKTVLLLLGLGLVTLHRANGRLLGLTFTQNQLLVLVYLVNLPQLLHWL